MQKSIIVVLCMLICLLAAGCERSDAVDEITLADTQTTAETEPVELPPYELKGNTLTVHTDKTDLRVMLVSDLHYNLSGYYTESGLSNEERLQLWVDSIMKEHEMQPIDLMLILGDISLDHHANLGPEDKGGVYETTLFLEKYMSQIPEEIPYYIIAGNHEQYTNEKWKELTGFDRQGVAVIGNNLFILVDQYHEFLPDGNCAYTPVDMNFINEQMAAYPEHDVWIASHRIDINLESDEFKKLIAEDDRVKGLFGGDYHINRIYHLGSQYNNKTYAVTGHFSSVGGSGGDPEVLMWGYRELLLNESGAVTNYIIAESDSLVNIGGGYVSRHYDRQISQTLDYNNPQGNLVFEEKYIQLRDKVVGISADGTTIDGSAGQLFDGYRYTRWCTYASQNPDNKIVIIDWTMSEPTQIDAYQFWNYEAAFERSPKAWVLYGWDDAKGEWVTIDTVTGNPKFKSVDERSEIFTVDAPGEYLRYRLHITHSYCLGAFAANPGVTLGDINILANYE